MVSEKIVLNKKNFMYRKPLRNKKLICNLLKCSNFDLINRTNEEIENLIYNMDCFISFIFESFDISDSIKSILCEKFLSKYSVYIKLIGKLDFGNQKDIFIDMVLKDFYDNILIMCIYINNKSYENYYIYDIDINNNSHKQKMFMILKKMVADCTKDGPFSVTTLFNPVKNMLIKSKDKFFPEISISYKTIWSLALNKISITSSDNRKINSQIYNFANIIMSVCYSDIDTFLIYDNLVIACNGVEGKKRLGIKIVNPDCFSLTSTWNIHNIEKRLQFDDGTILSGYQKIYLLKDVENEIFGFLVFNKKTKFTDLDLKNIFDHYSLLADELTNIPEE